MILPSAVMIPFMIHRAIAISGQSTSASPMVVASASSGPKIAHTGTAASVAASNDRMIDGIPVL